MEPNIESKKRSILLETTDRLTVWPMALGTMLKWAFIISGTVNFAVGFLVVPITYLSITAYLLGCSILHILGQWVGVEATMLMTAHRMKLAGALDFKSYEDFQNNVLENNGVKPEENHEVQDS